MGNAGSASASLQAVAAVSGAASLPLDAPEWQQLLTYATPLSKFDPGEVERELRPYCADLVYNNAQTLNLQRFIYLVAQQLKRARRQPGGGGAATANAVYCLRTILKDLTEQLNSEQLLSFVEVSPAVAAAAAAAGAEEQQAAAAATGGKQQAPADGGSGSGGSSPGTAAAGQGEFSPLHNNSLVHTLVCEAMLTLSDKRLIPSTSYMLLLECSQLLLVLFSSVLYSPSARGPLGQHPYLDAAMQQKELANKMVEALLRLFIAAPPVPLSLKIFHYMPTDTRSVLKIVRTAAASVLWLPYQAYTLLLRPARPPMADASGGAAAAPSNSPLGDSALLLLLALLFHAPPPDASFGNPYRQSLQRMQDADDLVTDEAAEGGRAAAAGDSCIGYAALFDALGSSLSSERAVLLLYVLLHSCPRFHEYCLVRSDLDTVLLPLLELLYSAQDRTPNQMYMLLIILLMLSQDSAFAQNIHKIVLPSVPFYRERSSARTTLGSLLVVLLLRTAHYNLAKLRDVYLHTNTLAALANLAPHMSGLSTHAAQRLVSLFHLLARRYSRLQAAAEGAQQPPSLAQAHSLESPVTPWIPAPTPASIPVLDATVPTAADGVAGDAMQQQQQQQQQHQQQAGAQQEGPKQQQQQGSVALPPAAGTEAGMAAASAAATVPAVPGEVPAGASEAQELELQLYADFLRIVLEIINAILTSALPQNPELVYTLLHRQEVFAPFVAHPRYSELMENIRRVTDHFNRKVEESVAASSEALLSVDRLLDIIKLHSRGWRKDRLKPFPDLRFTYEEEASPEEFFVPYVWSLVVAQGGIPFTLEAVNLFTPTIVPAPPLEDLAAPSPILSEGGGLPTQPSVDAATDNV